MFLSLSDPPPTGEVYVITICPGLECELRLARNRKGKVLVFFKVYDSFESGSRSEMLFNLGLP